MIVFKLDVLYRISSFTWLILLESNEPINQTKLPIPYNCQFIISYPMGKSNYKLIEVYKLKNRTFVSEFGFLNSNQLILANNYLFSRRMDFNGTVLTMDVKADQSVSI